MPLIATKGAASAQGFGEFAQTAVATYIEDVFSTYLYTGDNTNNRSFTNNIDLSGDGGLVWIKSRGPTAGIWHGLFDTARGANKRLVSNNSDAEGSSPAYGYVSAFNADGFTVTGGSSGYDNVNLSNENYASWTFRKAEKFFDVVTYTGNGQVSAQNIAHNLGSVPGMIIIKRTDTAANWAVYHRSMGATKFMRLNITNGEATSSDYWNNTEPTSTQFTVGIGGAVNDSGTYVAYLFAHDAGGFGLTGSDNVISCGSYTGTGSVGNTITLGYEPQWLLVKKTNDISDWQLVDNMRGFSLTNNRTLFPNLSNAEDTPLFFSPTSTGFTLQTTSTYANGSGSTYIYIAIRRGPMKTPTSGTSVYQAATAINASPAFISGFPVDAALSRYGLSSAGDNTLNARLTNTQYLVTNSTAAQTAASSYTFDFQNGWRQTDGSASTNQIAWMFGRAPGFFDVVCYTGTGSNTTISHNLGVVPELMIVKARNSASYDWGVFTTTTGAGNVLKLNLTDASTANTFYFNNTAPTSSVFSVGTSGATNGSGTTYVAYLFASVTGVSKVGSYTGTGTTLQVNCGFTGGARFVLIKRTDSTGDWYVWDSARGIVAGNDPYLLLNSTAAEVTNTDYVDTYSAGFEISSTAPAAINANGGTFIFLAIA